MLSIRSSIKASLITITALVMTLGVPAASLVTVNALDCTPPPANQAGVHWPTGADAPAFTYQCEGQYAGKWINTYYVYDPATSTKSPLYAADYQYDCNSKSWSKIQYDYSPASGQYYSTRVASADPGLATNCPVADPAPNSQSQGAGSGSTSYNAQGSGGSNNANNSLINDYNGTSANSVGMNNTITTVGTSGNALVLGNLVAGSAATGNTTSTSTILNKLQSASSSLGSANNTIVFTTEIDGDLNGDLMLDPNMLTQVQPASNNTSNNDLNNSLSINNSIDANIDNDITVKSNSGDATVSQNNVAGDATTGNANAVANIINVVNSALVSGQSFIGVININGNLNGDILLPPNFVDQLLAANVPTVTIDAPADSSNTDNTTVNNSSKVTNTNNQSITNNVDANAQSGDATVTKNNSGGNATTGSATSTITAFNLTGSNVIGSNALLVFVNVPGSWVGLIVNAPSGATAASLGGGITQNNTSVNNDSTVTNTANHKITNNIDVDAKSGDATVSENLKSGNAKSGNASSAVNLTNVENSNMSLSGWLGILFINVFGSWNGSFGVNTAAGDPIISKAIAQAQENGSSTPQVFRFVPRGNSSGASTPKSNASYDIAPYNGTNTNDQSPNPTNTILANAHIKANGGSPTPKLAGEPSGTSLATILVAAAVVTYILGDAAYTRRHPERA